jgi:hypothetical protein
VSIHNFASWAVFSADDNNFAPTFWSGKRASFEKHETTLLSTLRKWVGTYFAAHDGVTADLYKTLKGAKSTSKDFDVVAKVLSIFEMDEFTNELKIADATGDNWYVLALKLKFPNLRAGQVIRIRSATYDETSTHKNVLALQHYSNIMTFVNSSRLAKTISSKVSDDWKIDAAELAKEVPMRAIILSEVDKKWANQSPTSLNDLFHHEGSLSGNTFRTCFSVVKVESDHKEMVRSFNKTSKKTGSAKGSKGDLFW